MKSVIKFLAITIKYLFIFAIVLFAVATFMGKSYVQTFLLLIIAASLAYWPSYLGKKWNNRISYTIRILFITLLLVMNYIFFKPGPKTSIYLSDIYKKKLMELYDQKMKNWPKDTKDLYFQTEYGKVHILACGLKENPPLIMIHAASMGAHSWAENLEPLLNHYRIYSIDNIGEGNKSELNDALKYPQNGRELADLYAKVADSLGVIRSPVFGASNGGFIAMNYAYFYPEKVESLALFGPMGLTNLTHKSIMMLSLATMYPFQFVRNFVTDWALGKNNYVLDKYGDWFNCIMQGTIPSMAKPEPMKVEQKKKMDLPVLLFLGTKDQIVGDAQFAEKAARDFPDIIIEILDSGHLIAVEHFEVVNKKLGSFLHIE
jgi:pimeloyl-ACP methyl ester carboxylesterase